MVEGGRVEREGEGKRKLRKLLNLNCPSKRVSMEADHR